MSERGASSGPLSTTAGFLAALPRFLRAPVTAAESAARIREHLADRAGATVRLFTLVAADPENPYAQLLRHVGVTPEDVAALVAREGVEGALTALHAAGVYVTLDEFKGRAPIRRGSLTVPASASMFDNHALTTTFAARTGGSRSAGRALAIDLDLVAHEGAYECITLTQFGMAGRDRLMWRPVPPGTAGIKTLLRSAKAGFPITRWYSQSRVWSREEWRHTAFTAALMATSRLTGRPLAAPSYLPLGGIRTIVDALAARVAAGRPAVLETNAASAVRVCQAALEAGRSLEGTFFRIGGEPFTPGKAEVIARAGGRAASHYSLSEAGRLANPCARPAANDDAHVATEKVALLARDVYPGGGPEPVPGLFLTTIYPSTPKVMINVELGDYARLGTRACGCAWDDLGLTLHVEDIRSYEKLVAEGMHFIGADLLTLIDETLPRHFGGTATDYQLVEEEADGLPTVTLVISPRVTSLDEAAVRETVMKTLAGSTAAARMMSTRWHEAGTLRIARREPHATAAGKVLALHVPQPRRTSDA